MYNRFFNRECLRKTLSNTIVYCKPNSPKDVRIFNLSYLPTTQSSNKAVDVRKKPVEVGFVEKCLNLTTVFSVEKTRLKISARLAHENILATVNYDEWREELELPDTFGSWYCVTELHVWLLLVRYMVENNTPNSQEIDVTKRNKGDGSLARHHIIMSMWDDVTCRLKLMQNKSVINETLHELSSIFSASIASYDEGLDDDKILSATVWRRFYGLSESCKIEHIEKVVNFIRHQLIELDEIPSDEMKRFPDIRWLSIKDH